MPTKLVRKLLVHFVIVLTLVTLLTVWMYFSIQNVGDSFVYLFLQALNGIVLFILPPVYLTIYWLIPYLLTRKKYLLFVVGFLLVTVFWGYFVGYAEPWIDEHWFGQTVEPSDPASGLVAVGFIIGLSVLFNLSYNWFVQRTRISQMENDQLKKELALLKNQINPHFFFNTLNNLYALSLERSDQTSEVILKLSELMRYTIYECKDSFVSIEKEVKYLENFISLQLIRHYDCKINFKKNIDAPNINIAPMILVVLLENAFKHGVEGLADGAFVNLDLEVDKKSIVFQVENNFKQKDGSDHDSGLGLDNVQKRLALIYDSRFILRTFQENEIFHAYLRIDHD